jgi:hypothetical protein
MVYRYVGSGKRNVTDEWTGQGWLVRSGRGTRRAHALMRQVEEARGAVAGPL